jgi:putative phosphoribosyl transferase
VPSPGGPGALTGRVFQQAARLNGEFERLKILSPERLLMLNIASAAMAVEETSIPLKDVTLGANIMLPRNASGLVIFAHGSGSSRHSPRNQYVAGVLREAGLGTLLFDLLTAEEEQAEAYTRHLRFNIPFLAERLVGVTRWALDLAGRATNDEMKPRQLKIGYFGSSTGAAAALVAAAELSELIGAVVSRGGRPDLADALEQVKAPTLLIVGSEDRYVIKLNEQACSRLRCEKALRIIPGASHLFEEPGTLENAAEIASEWFVQHLQHKAPV